MKVADFFCGAGGFSEGFRQAGFDIVLAVDKWEPACTTYKGNKPKTKVLQEDIIGLSKLPDKEFDDIIPDTEIIIGSPPCVAFSSSNKSGKADKTMGIELLEAYLRIIARKKFKKNSILKYWILENVPNIQKYIKEEYSAADLGLDGNYMLKVKGENSNIYNAKYYGTPSNRKRYLCGDFIKPKETNCDENLVTINDVFNRLGVPLEMRDNYIIDPNYIDFSLPINMVSDHQYVYEVAEFEWKKAKQAKCDKGYMGKMSFPEKTDRPARTVMATMSSCSRESMIFKYKQGYRLPTVREIACFMSFPIDYMFYGKSKATKYTLVGNAVPPKLSFALAKAIAIKENIQLPLNYIPINHDATVEFYNLNNKKIEVKAEKKKSEKAKFKYHIPYMIINAYRVELTNKNSDFKNKRYVWSSEIHYSQGKDRAKIFKPIVELNFLPKNKQKKIEVAIAGLQDKMCSMNELQERYRMTDAERVNIIGPLELLEETKKIIYDNLSEKEISKIVELKSQPNKLPVGTCVGFYILKKVLGNMEG